MLNVKSTKEPLFKSPILDQNVNRLKIEINESECNLLRKRIQDAIPNQVIEKIILINANASDIIPLRKWPIMNFVKLSNLLLTDSTITIILTGSSNEYDKCEECENVYISYSI